MRYIIRYNTIIIVIVVIIGPILWGHIGPLCHALSLSSSLSVVVVDIDAQAAYKNCCIDHNQILQSDRDPQILTVGGPNMPQTNPRWRTAAIL